MAYKKGYKFHGNFVNTPGVYSYVKSDMRANKSNGALNIALIGQSEGGIPGQIMFLDDTDSAKSVLKGGELLTACLKAYDPVVATKTGVELGGADLIFAIRSNAAQKAQTAVYQEKEVEATIGTVVVTKHANTTGKISISGTFTGNTNKTYKVMITSEGTKALSDCTYNYSLASDDTLLSSEDLKLSETGNATNKDIGDGVLVTFGEGNYTKGDTFLIPCTAEVTVNEFVFTIESKDYGKECNLIQHKVDAGTKKGTKKLTIYNGAKDRYEVLDNMGGTFTIKYTGTQTYADISIVSNGEGEAIKLQTKIGTDKENSIVDLDIDLQSKQFTSIKALAEYINGYADYEAVMVETINPDLKIGDFDFVSEVSIKAEFPVTAILRDFKKSTKLLSENVEINIINREVSNFKNYSFEPLSGGSEGKSATSYLPFLDELAKYDIDYIVPLTDDISIIAEVREHCIAMSEKQGKERRMVCGVGKNTPAGMAVQYAKKLQHGRVQLVGTGFYDRDGVLYPGYIAAAMHAGRAAFLGVESATGDTYNIAKPEMTYEGEDRNSLMNNGVLFFDEIVSDFNHKQFYSRLVWDYTTFTEYDDPVQVERTTGAIADRISKEVRKELHKILTGKLAPTGTLESARNKVLTILKEYVKQGIIVEYNEVNVVKKRDKTNITFGVAPVQVNNFTFVDIDFYDKDIQL